MLLGWGISPFLITFLKSCPGEKPRRTQAGSKGWGRILGSALTWPHRSSPTPMKMHQNHWLRVSPEQLKGFPPNSTMMICSTGDKSHTLGTSQGVERSPWSTFGFPLSWDYKRSKDLTSRLGILYNTREMQKPLIQTGKFMGHQKGAET